MCELKLIGVKAELVTLFHAIKNKYPSAHVSCGYRDQAAQDDAFSDGKSHLKFPLSAHNKTPALAIDIFQINDAGKAVFDKEFYASVAADIKAEGLPFIWGGNFKSLGDSDHYQFHPESET